MAARETADELDLESRLGSIQSQLRQFEDDPLIIDRARGIYLYDTTGHRLLDSMAGYWLACLGYGDPEIVKTLARASERLSFWHIFETAHSPVLRYVGELQKYLPDALRGKILFANTGSAAMENALRVACARDAQLRRKSVLAHFDRSYHGSTFLAQQATPWNDWPDSLRLPEGRVQQIPSPSSNSRAQQCIEALDTLCRGEHAPTMLLTEPIQGVGGMVVPPAGFFDELAAVCRRNEITWISDEISTGFGSTGRLFAFEWNTALPDIVVVGKKIAAGYFPMSGAIISQQLACDVLEDRPFHYGYSTSGHPVGCEVARVVLRRVSDPKLLSNVISRGVQLRTGLEEIKKHRGVIRSVCGEGLMVAAELPKSDFTHKIGQKMRELGVYQLPEGKYLTFCPAFVISPEEIDELLNVVDRAIVECS